MMLLGRRMNTRGESFLFHMKSAGLILLDTGYRHEWAVSQNG